MSKLRDDAKKAYADSDWAAASFAVLIMLLGFVLAAKAPLWVVGGVGACAIGGSSVWASCLAEGHVLTKLAAREDELFLEHDSFLKEMETLEAELGDESTEEVTFDTDVVLDTHPPLSVLLAAEPGSLNILRSRGVTTTADALIWSRHASLNIHDGLYRAMKVLRKYEDAQKQTSLTKKFVDILTS